MDETANAFAYRCLPLTLANSHGWEMLCPFAFEAVWTGGAELASVEISPQDEAAGPAYVDFVTSHFGSGILTFNPLLIVRTDPGYDLWVAGPANAFKDGIQAMTAAIETDWMPYTFTVSWKFTRPHTVVRFERDEPFCTFFPARRGVVAECEPRLRRLSDDPELDKAYRWALARRDLDTTLAEDTREQFQGWYKKGEMPDRAPVPVEGHQTAIKAKPFTR